MMIPRGSCASPARCKKTQWLARGSGCRDFGCELLRRVSRFGDAKGAGAATSWRGTRGWLTPATLQCCPPMDLDAQSDCCGLVGEVCGVSLRK